MHARLISMGPLGGALKFTTTSATTPATLTATAAPRVIVLADRSGSMGGASSRIPGIVQRGLQAHLAPTTVVTYIAFDSVSSVFSQPLGSLDTLRTPAQGGTNMSPALEDVMGVLRGMPPNPQILFVVISDGDIVDKVHTTAKTKTILARLQALNASVAAIMVQVGSSADVEAMCGLSAAGTRPGSVAHFQIPPDLYKDTEVQMSVNRLSAAVAATGVGRQPCVVELTEGAVVAGGGLRTFPTEKFASSTTISATGGFVLVDGAAYTALATGDAAVLVDGVVVPIEHRTSVHELDDLFTSLAYLLRVWNMGGAHAADTALVHKWAQDVQQFVRDTAAEATAAAGPGDTVFNQRIKALLKASDKTQQTALQTLLHSANVAARNDLATAQQKYAYLNGTVTSALAKRCTVSDASKVASEALRRLFTVLDGAGRAGAGAGGAGAAGGEDTTLTSVPVADDAEDTAAASFYTVQTAWDMVQDLTALTPRDRAQLLDGDAGDIVTLCGLLGVCVRHRVAPFVDPWCLRLDAAYLGTYLTVGDVLTTSIQGSLKAPGQGPEDVITAVVPLVNLNPKFLWGFFNRKTDGADLRDLGISAMIRRTFVPVPYDALAMQAALLHKLLRMPVTELSTRTRVALMLQLSYALGTGLRPAFADLAAGLGSDHPSSVLVEGNGTAITKALLVLVASPDCAGVRADVAATTRALLALFDLSVYRAVRRMFDSAAAAAADAAESRTMMLHTLLNVTLGDSDTDVTAVFADTDPADMARRAADIFNTPSAWWWNMVREDAAALQGVFELLGHSDDNGLFNGAIVRAAVLVHALQCPDEAARRASDTVPARFVTESGAAAYLQETAAALVAAADAAREARRAAAAAHAAMLVAVTALARTDTMAAFLDGLKEHVPNRSVPAFGVLLKLLTESSVWPAHVAHKAFVLATGHAVLGTADGDRTPTAVWCSGNVAEKAVRDAVHALLSRCEDFGQTNGGVFTRDFLASVVKSCRQSYQRLNANRHGHHDGFPSYFMMGYKTMEEFQEESPQDYAEYVKLHAPHECCGLRPPKPARSARGHRSKP
jgi:hypothetical protein